VGGTHPIAFDIRAIDFAALILIAGSIFICS
jgi:hypothetical protein